VRRTDDDHHFGDEPVLVNVVPGDEVQHEAFGVGRVVEVKGHGSDAEVTVRFEEGEKRLMLAYAHLTKPS
jgi:DNA helicase-2/ATP-dependent DNA helicase PcrA